MHRKQIHKLTLILQSLATQHRKMLLIDDAAAEDVHIQLSIILEQ